MSSAAEALTGAYREGDSGEYGRTGARGRYEQEAAAAYSGDSMPGGAGGYREERADPYEDEPTGVYRGGNLTSGFVSAA